MLQLPAENLGTKLKNRLGKGCILLPGVYDAISALTAKKCGAEALYISGAGVTNSRLAVPDIALLTVSELADSANNIVNITQLPAISDADTGFGEALNVKRTVHMLENSGLAGIHLEDQVSPKRCGHLDGKAIIPKEHMVQKIHAACESRRNPDFMIVARTDARSVEGIDAAIHRANLYVQNGADMIFPEGLYSEDEFKMFRDAVKAPLMANMTEFGKTPIISKDSFEKMGYEVVIFPMTAFRMMLQALVTTYEELLSKGTQQDILDKMQTRKQLYEILEYAKYTELDTNWLE